MRRLAAAALAYLITLAARLVTAARAVWAGVPPLPEQRIYFANHRSNGDFVLIWTMLPPALRARSRPVAGADYWLGSALRRFVIRDVFDAVLVDRSGRAPKGAAIVAMLAALDAGRSLILFPEGTRNAGEAPLLPFRPGLYHLAAARPEIPLVPVWIENLNRVMPKGEVVPVPLICTVVFGEALQLEPGEERDAFLARAAAALAATREAECGP
ncbi:lysophospholipid acyltransferase family protein [Paralimibaculum aggregatum]|uniref:Lysophospholipid acyltransferase family protein n=1 Tax=Paralimibaculum aggregatum TaxID=3036245 RepID=A0ABQ6LFE5_9RHOB|nr:lysophospholipid acyltransferase family protein [Limibaculum sp. NKW23]GMG82051.1 lysophospholipid acyltransferase family protein [Limibaculum sp. NKW23]